MDKCLSEVNCRTSEIVCTDFECSLERFKTLATENSKLTSGTAREYIMIFQIEIQSYYINAWCEDYGLNVKNLNFLLKKQLGEFENIIHVEVKNAFGSAIKITNSQKGNIAKQGKKIEAKLYINKIIV